VLAIALVGGAYFIGIGRRDDNGADNASLQAPDPGYAARDAEVIETGYDGRERYRLNARVIRQQSDGGVIDLEQLEMNYHPGAQAALPGDRPAAPTVAGETWHLTSDRGQVRANGDDVQLNGNVVVTGRARHRLPADPDHRGHAHQHADRVHRDGIPRPTPLVGTRTPVAGHESRFEGRDTASRIRRTWRILTTLATSRASPPPAAWAC
jgi:LPS export ABC transporter protein LptC